MDYDKKKGFDEEYNEFAFCRPIILLMLRLFYKCKRNILLDVCDRVRQKARTHSLAAQLITFGLVWIV